MPQDCGECGHRHSAFRRPRRKRVAQIVDDERKPGARQYRLVAALELADRLSGPMLAGECPHGRAFIHEPSRENFARLRSQSQFPPRGFALPAGDRHAPALQVDVLATQTIDLLRAATLEQNQPANIVQILKRPVVMLDSALILEPERLEAGPEVCHLFSLREHVHPDRVGIARHGDRAHWIYSGPIVLDRILEELRKRVKIVTQRNLSNLLLAATPRLVILDASRRDRGDRQSPEEFAQTSEAGPQRARRAGMLSALRIGPCEELGGSVIEAYHPDSQFGCAARQHQPPHLRFYPLGCIPISFCGGQDGYFRVLSAVHPEPDFPFPAAFPYRHDCSSFARAPILPAIRWGSARSLQVSRSPARDAGRASSPEFSRIPRGPPILPTAPAAGLERTRSRLHRPNDLRFQMRRGNEGPIAVGIQRLRRVVSQNCALHLAVMIET